MLLKEGDVITWRAGSVKTEYYKIMMQALESKVIPGWLSLDKTTMTGKVLSIPTPEDIQVPFSAKSIVEYYSR